ncbi:hypothetical protein DBB36_02150 [Flavobacterium sp. WLB]|uniref:hypothetical protein n=1 Tax=unclassified Flavobacterium TaxID=196869 RepID=UPI0006AB81E0|nr:MULTISPECIES: hypothetical protein [unclassified Flavobacterium]KOP39222.1 hypothetical protein AKO67_06670 [Flavobacterium sp. VMW]OWU89115.1 hypothetical protein APR43_18085 [Flavobacterium sp. NLM]PUU71682.1 hypothetical protein DBB36_02150 [Flavobacterium sp. WLB]
MDTNYNRIKVADLEKNERDKILTTNSSGELEFSDVNNIKTDSYNALDYTKEGKALDARQGKVLKDLIDNIKDTLKTYFDTLYLGISNDQNVSGIKTFLTGKLGLRNVANTFTSFFTNTVTASRTWTLPDKNGIIAMTSDLPRNIVGTGAQNYLSKYNNTEGTQLGNSRFIDTGTYAGIDTVTTPTKTLSLGYQGNREIGIEDSDSSTVGKDLTITAGRTINYQLTASFVNLNQAPKNNRKGQAAPNGDVYLGAGNSVYRQVGGVGDFIVHRDMGVIVYSIAINSTNDIFIATANGLYKQTNATGTPVLEAGVTNRTYYSMSFHSAGHLYAICAYSDQGGNRNDYIYKRLNNTGNFIAESVASGAHVDIACAPNGDVYVAKWAVGLLKQTGGTGAWVNIYSNTSLGSVCVLTNGTIYTLNVYGGIIPYFAVSINNGISFSNSSFQSPLGITSPYSFLTASGNNVYMYGWSNSTIYFQNNDALGVSNLNGGVLKLKSGTGKGTGQSKVQIITGQKSFSGTNMQTEAIRLEIDENGNIIVGTDRIFSNNAAAIAGGLPPRAIYWTTTGEMRIVV